MNKNSYTAANSIPIKLLLNPQWVREGKITPIHAQFMPTRKITLICRHKLLPYMLNLCLHISVIFLVPFVLVVRGIRMTK